MSAGRLAVIGGGPAGMLAAGRAAQLGADVVLLEKGPKLGRKLRISGKGRGNITNTADLADFVEAFAPNGKFLYSAFSRFFRDDLLDLLRSLGVETKVERGGRVFPVCERASEVADALTAWIKSLGLRVKVNTAVRGIATFGGRVRAVEVFGGRMDVGAAVIATGGASYPKTGSTGDGYEMAREVGHEIIPPASALSALVTQEDWVKHLQGFSLRNVEATLMAESGAAGRPQRIAGEFGETVFTHFGISGPIILALSRKARTLLDGGRVSISIDLKPGLSEEQLHSRLIADFRGGKQLKNYLRGLLPRLLADAFPALCGIDPDKPVNVITSAERAQLVSMLKGLKLTVLRLGPLEEAIVTAGGVSIRQIDPKTMMSKLVDGLFFAGEVIDVDAETGGFNLQAAFSTGHVAGEAAADYVRRIER